MVAPEHRTGLTQAWKTIVIQMITLYSRAEQKSISGHVEPPRQAYVRKRSPEGEQNSNWTGKTALSRKTDKTRHAYTHIPGSDPRESLAPVAWVCLAVALNTCYKGCERRCNVKVKILTAAAFP